MKIGLIDVDSHNFPNLALMKISEFHKAKGDYVERVFMNTQYDKVYMSKVFDFTPEYEYPVYSDQIEKGGRAYDKKKVLPQEIESMYPDYSLYNIKNTAYGYLTRGCPRACGFCDVVNIEGKKSYKVADLSQFWKGEKEIVLLDPNLLASPDRIDLLKQLADSKARVDFCGGLDIRFITDEIIDLIKKIRINIIHFAWDQMNDSETMIKHFQNFKLKTGMDRRKLCVYVLVNFNTTHEEDLYRIYKLREIGYDPYVMMYDKKTTNKETRQMARWVNNKIIFGSCAKFEDYMIGVK